VVTVRTWIVGRRVTFVVVASFAVMLGAMVFHVAPDVMPVVSRGGRDGRGFRLALAPARRQALSPHALDRADVVDAVVDAVRVRGAGGQHGGGVQRGDRGQAEDDEDLDHRGGELDVRVRPLTTGPRALL